MGVRGRRSEGEERKKRRVEERQRECLKGVVGIILKEKFKRKIEMSDRKAVIKNADMSEEMQQDAIDIAVQALEKFNIEKDIAAFIKK